jgi:hypothetical protein
MPRLVRRKPFIERMKAILNPMDFLLWLSEEMETRDWDSQLVGTQIGLALNFVFLLARANSGPSSSSGDDIFGDDSGGSWLRFVVSSKNALSFSKSCTLTVFEGPSSGLGFGILFLHSHILCPESHPQVPTIPSRRRRQAINPISTACETSVRHGHILSATISH